MTGTGLLRLPRSARSGDAEVAPKKRAEATSAIESFMLLWVIDSGTAE